MNDEELVKVVEASLAKGSYERDDLYLFNVPLAWLMTNEAHVHQGERTVVLDAMRAHGALTGILDGRINMGNRATRVTDEQVCNWLLTKAKAIGARRAVEELRRFIDEDHCACDEILAISGLSVVAPIRLFGDVELVPFGALSESQVTIGLLDPTWEYFGRLPDGRIRRKAVEIVASFGRAEYHHDPQLPTAALRRRHRLVPKIMNSDAELSQKCNLPLLLAVANVSAVAACVPVFPVAYWWAADSCTPCGDSGGQVNSWSHSKGMRRLAYAHEVEAPLREALSRYMSLDEVRRGKLQVPLERFNLAVAAASPVNRAIDLAVALEALLLADHGATDPPSQAFRLRGAWLLGRTTEDRARLYLEFKALYDCRSTAVHTGELPKQVKLLHGKIPAGEFLDSRAPRLAAEAILEMMASPDRNWTSAILGG